MIETLTLLLQFGILGGLALIQWNLYRTTKMAREMTIQLARYRREIDWLTARLDGVQGVRPNGEGIRPQAAETGRDTKAI